MGLRTHYKKTSALHSRQWTHRIHPRARVSQTAQRYLASASCPNTHSHIYTSGPLFVDRGTLYCGSSMYWPDHQLSTSPCSHSGHPLAGAGLQITPQRHLLRSRRGSIRHILYLWTWRWWPSHCADAKKPRTPPRDAPFTLPMSHEPSGSELPRRDAIPLDVLPSDILTSACACSEGATVVSAYLLTYLLTYLLMCLLRRSYRRERLLLVITVGRH